MLPPYYPPMFNAANVNLPVAVPVEPLPFAVPDAPLPIAVSDPNSNMIQPSISPMIDIENVSPQKSPPKKISKKGRKSTVQIDGMPDFERGVGTNLNFIYL